MIPDRAGDVLLVGSVPLSDAATVMRTCGRHLGRRLSSLPDGETGDRVIWVVFQAYRVFDGHPQLETVARPAAAKPGEDREDWMPTSMADLWDFRVKADAGPVVFDDLRYAEVAAESYETFRALRDAGEIDAHLRFQVSLPLPMSAVSWFFRAPGEIDKVFVGYQRALLREVEKLTALIPAQDLAIQWDVCWEVLDIEGIFPHTPAGDPWQRFVDGVETMSAVVPDEATMGLHLCYADLGHRHMMEPKDLSLVVKMANRACEVSKHPVQWVHMPVPRDRDDDAYFAPLANLDAGQTRVFLGLVHHTDGVEGTLRRLATAKKHLSSFGIATECGLGRRPAGTIPGLLDIHDTVADAL
ncbi:MAG: hypothetical protein AAGF11_21645 [Myxococcota bacterium]